MIAIAQINPGPAVYRENYADHLAALLEATTFRSKGDRTRFRLKQAAARVLEEAGYNELKVADICAAAEVALGTFYVYFKDKNEIAIEVVLDFLQHLYRQAVQVGRGQGEYEAILKTNRFFVAAYQENPGLMRCLVQLQSQLPEFQAAWRPLHHKWVEILARSIERRGNYAADMPANALAVAHALESMVFQFLYTLLVSRESVLERQEAADSEEIAEMLSILWYRAVYGRDPVRGEGAISGQPASDRRKTD